MKYKILTPKETIDTESLDDLEKIYIRLLILGEEATGFQEGKEIFKCKDSKDSIRYRIFTGDPFLWIKPHPELISAVIDLFPGIYKLSHYLRRTAQTIYSWKNGNREIQYQDWFFLLHLIGIPLEHNEAPEINLDI